MSVRYNRFTTHIKEDDKSNVSIIILSAGIGSRMRSYGPRCLFKVDHRTILQKQIEILDSVFKNNEIILVVGFEASKVIKKVPPNIRIVENQMHEETNSFESLRLGINNAINNKVLFLHGDLIFNKKTFSDVKFNKSFIITDSAGQMKDSEVGVTVVNNKATCFAYGLDTKWCQMAFLKGKEYDIMRSIALKRNKSTFYTFEALNLIVEKHGNLTAFEPEQMFIKEIDSMKDLK